MEQIHGLAANILPVFAVHSQIVDIKVSQRSDKPSARSKRIILEHTETSNQTADRDVHEAHHLHNLHFIRLFHVMPTPSPEIQEF